jgi:RNA polymerase sigma-70 factor (ECF subfamily)
MNPIRHHTETELITLLMEGDKHTFAHVYKMYADPLLSHVRKSVPDREDCKEIVHDIFESLWTRRHLLLHITSLRPYLYQMARNKIIDHMRHNVVKRKYREHFQLFESVYEPDEEPLHDLTRFSAWVNDNMERLPERCQEAFRLRVTHNMTYKDIAMQMNISTKTVEKHISAALKHLRHNQNNVFRI